ncbi:protocadherin-11 X-linked-like isoform X2 [Mya arenaria]|uniref:protocadherin-11 X-linked-like isoform X2 n=1 Tax=Mya arenaria TaxID=6604 RepID=UPI0022E6DFCE|nr:protocadherin-11 X-linked-like isoform X2 [Mya arenaria]XP_052797223.1 protocadherin-11 X-linked-like isoform X2 [Mya arenaria]
MALPRKCEFRAVSCLCWIYFTLFCLALRGSVDAADLTYTVDEEQPRDTLVGDISVDYDLRSIMTSDEYNNLQYQILSTGNEFAKYFKVENTTGKLLTTEPIDRDSICIRSTSCKLSLNVAVSTIGAFFRKIVVDVNVQDLNDNSPDFPKAIETVDFSENSAVGMSQSIKGAVDRDAGNNSVARYYIETPNVPFDVDMESYVDGSSFVKIIVNGNLNREKTDFYSITIVAEDGGSPKRTGSVDVNINIIDVNDNSPKFDVPFYNVTLLEDTPLNTVFLTVSAVDSDLGDNGRVEYALSPNQNSDDIAKSFAVERTSGNISVIGQLEYIPNVQTSIYVDAYDHGAQPRSSKIVVLVNIVDSSNNPPQINVNILHGDSTKRIARVTEYSNIGSPVAHIGVIDTDYDKDRNGKVDCIAISDYFGLERYEANDYKAVVKTALDREAQDKHEVQIVCRDNGSPPLNTTTSFSVEVTDENDNYPRFTHQNYFVKTEENNKVGEIVAKVSATDLDKVNTSNSKIQYKLSAPNDDRFWMDPDTGEIRANVVLDRENTSRIDLKVIAQDHGSPRLSATANVSLSITDQNDNYPAFSQPNYEFFVYENLPYNTSVDQLTASDKDDRENGTIVFSFSKPVPSNFPFTLYSDGNIKVIRPLDRELQSKHEFTVIAADQGTPPLTSSVTVTVNVLDQNDNVPVFVFPNDDNYTTVIPLANNPDSVTIEIQATDRDSGDNGKVNYQIIGKNLSDMFEISSIKGMGVISLNRMPYGNEPLSYTLGLKAEDNGTPRQSAYSTLTVTFKRAIPPEDNRTNFLIAITLGCVTVVLSIIIVLIIYLIRRNDHSRRKNDTSYGDKADLQIRPEIKHPTDLASTSSGSKESLKKVSFSTDHNSSIESEPHRDVLQAPLVSLDNLKIYDKGRVPSSTSSPRSFSPSTSETDGQKLDPATVLQIHRSLLQSHDQMWTNHREGHTII